MEDNLRCIRDKCDLFFSSDDYFETCNLVSKRVLLTRCFGLTEVKNKKEEITCKIAKLVSELEYLDGLEELVRNYQR